VRAYARVEATSRGRVRGFVVAKVPLPNVMRAVTQILNLCKKRAQVRAIFFLQQ
jgi:hypothetical protein